MTEPIPIPDPDATAADARELASGTTSGTIRDTIAAAISATISAKFVDAMTPGYRVEFDPFEAERAGAFVEDALSEADAFESQLERIEPAVPGRAREG